MRTRLALAGSMALIAAAVFPWGAIQDHAHWSNVRWIPYVSPPIRIRDIAQNIVLFVPLGRALGHRYPRRAVVALALMLSVAGEWTQVYSHGRIPSGTDVVNNAIGAWVGDWWARRTDAAGGGEADPGPRRLQRRSWLKIWSFLE